jgi:hypothetical protein
MVDVNAGVVVDFADPSAAAVGSDGTPVPKRYKISLEADTDGVRRLAHEAAKRGDEAQAARIAGIIGENPPKVSFFEKSVTRGDIVIGVGATGVVVGGVYLTRALVRRHRMKKLTSAGGKVLKMPAVR